MKRMQHRRKRTIDPMASKNEHFISIGLDKQLLRQVDDYRFKHRFMSRVEAMRFLIRKGLNPKLQPPENEAGERKGE